MHKRFKEYNILNLIILLSIMFISLNFFIQDTQPFGFTILKVSSNSMIPTFKKGSFIIIKKQADYTVGDIITYIEKRDNKKYYVTHRIIEKNGNEYITKGDANNQKDKQIIYENDIKGKVIFHTGSLL